MGLETVTLLFSAARSAKDLDDFFSTNTHINALSSIADNEVKAAKRVLSMITFERNKENALNRALTHLESAHEGYMDIWKNTEVRRNDDAMAHGINPINEELYQYKDIFVCLYMALIHKYLKSSPKIIKKYTQEAIDAFEGTKLNEPKMSPLGMPFRAAGLIFGLTTLIPRVIMEVNNEDAQEASEFLRGYHSKDLIKEFAKNLTKH
ncbi:hypothetical protein MICCA_3350004 [Microcystis aeruginosa PCC 9432]|jgi:hypothetical protein|uniref:Uncharacterized protein n=1 Tax=Microcystis aeruginosa PCC 9432 TaxID=1160280 RepID=A0A822LBF8_MICAE|nr:hypothetical protein [Microcystis aeruginosa]TRT91241.1 MAG: hypothetical protein EWV62_23905 [Microcystis aeruginosa Ma_OC_LR_19540900_S633]CCH93813.1 hypothetical protein MICCA_3350004 [Microcystis aeruginosa PCC 9432]